MTTLLGGRTILFLVTEDWYFWSHRLPVARAAQAAGARVIVAARPGQHVASIEAEGFDFRPINIDRTGLNIVRDLRSIAAIVRLYQLEKPDLVHHVAVKPVLLGSIAAQLSSRRAIVNALAGLGFLFTSDALRSRLLRGLFLKLLRACGSGAQMCTIVQNDDDRKILEAAGFPQKSLRTIRGSGVDLSAFPHKPEPSAPPVIAVCASRMLWDKGIGELVDAARLMKARGLPVRVRLVGSTDRNPASIPLATLEDWAREGIVEVVGFSDDIAGEYERAHIAVLPSYREGLPKTLLEAASCGRAMVASDVPGCREICRHEDTGLLVAKQDPEALAAAIERLACDVELRRRLANRAREVVAEQYSDSTVARLTLGLYAELIATSATLRPKAFAQVP